MHQICGASHRVQVSGLCCIAHTDEIELERSGETRDERQHGRNKLGLKRGLLCLLHILVVGEGQPFQLQGNRFCRAVDASNLENESTLVKSGFFFCGIALDPVEKASGRKTKPNSAVANSVISSANRLRCSPTNVSACKYSRMPSRSLVESIELAVGPPNPGWRAAIVRSSCERGAGDGTGAERAIIQSRRAVIQAIGITQYHLDVGQHPMGDKHGLGALHVRVSRASDGIAGLPSFAPRRASAHVVRASTTCPIWERTYRRRSVATCSLRERPVCSLRPRSPMRSTRDSSTKWWMSSAM